jgi:hypothetical protein
MTIIRLLEVIKKFIIVSDSSRGVAHQVFSVAGFRKSDDVTNAVSLTQNGNLEERI